MYWLTRFGLTPLSQYDVQFSNGTAPADIATVALAGGGADRHGKAVVDDTGDPALDPADMVEIGDHAITDIADARRQQGEAPRRHIDDLARKLAAVGQHVAAQQVHGNTLMPPPLFRRRQDDRFVERQRHVWFRDGIIPLRDSRAL